MAAEVPDPAEAGVPGASTEDTKLSPCCQVWWKKYHKAERGRSILKKAVDLMKNKYDEIEAKNSKLEKAYKEEQAQANQEKDGRKKELAARASLEVEISALKSEISYLKQNRASDSQDTGEEIKLLQAQVSEGEKEIILLNQLLKKEKKRADSEMKNVEVETRKAAEALKSVEVEKIKVDEERRLVNIEKKKAEDYRLQLDSLNKEISEAKSKLASDISKFEESKKIEAEKQKGIEERKRADFEMTKSEEQRKLAEANKKEISQLKKLLEKEKRRAESEKKNAEVEKKKAAEALKSMEAKKGRADEERWLANIEKKKAEDYRLQLDALKKELNEVKSKLVAEASNFKEVSKQLDAEKQKAIEERKWADLEMAKAVEQRKLAEANKKTATEDQSCADNLFKQLKDAKRETEELKKQKQELALSKRLGVVCFGQPDRNTNAEAENVKASLLASDFLQSEEANKRLQVEKKKAISVKKRVDAEMKKAEEQRKLAEMNGKKAMEEKSRADHLCKQLEEARLKIEELQKQMHELSSSRVMVKSSAVSCDKDLSAEVAKIKHLKKKLKLEKRRVKHAKEVVRLEKDRSNILQHELYCLKLDLVQFSHRLDIMDKCFSTPTEGKDGMAKADLFANIQMFKLKEKLCTHRSCQLMTQNGNQLLKPNCKDLIVSDPVKEAFDHDVDLLPIFGGNSAKSISGTDSKLKSLLGGSNQKILPSSAIHSSTASFSDRQLVGSQDRGAVSITTSAKLGQENLNVPPAISGMCGEITRCEENLAVVAENSVRSSLPVDKINGNKRKRKNVLDAVESIEFLCSEGRKVHVQLEEKLSLLHGMLDIDKGELSEEAKLVPNLLDDSDGKHDRPHKKRKKSHEDKVVLKHLYDDGQPRKMKNFDTGVGEVAAQVFGENTCGLITPASSFEEVVNGDYMKLLDLDSATDEECYKVAMEKPLSPTLPEIALQGIETFGIDNSEPSVDEHFCEELSNEKEKAASSCSFDVIDVDIDSNKLKYNRLSPLHNLLRNNNEGSLGSYDIIRSNESDFYISVPADRACFSHTQNSRVEVEMLPVPSSMDEKVNIPYESELGSASKSIPKFCIVFSNMEIDSISRIFSAIRSCMDQCSLPIQTEWVVHMILLALKREEKLPVREKVCLFFSLVLFNFSTSTLGKCSLNQDFIPCLNSFSEHINSVMSDSEARSVFAEFCLDELLSLIEHFLIDGRVMVNIVEPRETSDENGEHFLIGGVNTMLSCEAASADQLVAGSIVLSSICAVTNQGGFLCEAAYNIFRMHRYNTSVVLTVLHAFAYLCGDAFFTSSQHTLTIFVVKSVVMFLENGCVSVAAAPCPFAECPFSKDAVSVDIATTFLMEKLQSYAQSGRMHQDLMVNSSHTSVLSYKDNGEQSSGWEEVHRACGMPASCCLDKCRVPAIRSESVVDGTLCHISDVLSLVELIASKMSWDWIFTKVITRLFAMVECSVLENFIIAIIVLLGELGRIGISSVGCEDKGIKYLTSKLSAFLWRKFSIRAGLTLQIAAVTSLLGIVSLDFKKVIQNDFELPEDANQLFPTDLIRNWFHSLSEEQQALTYSLFESAFLITNRGSPITNRV